MIFTENLAYIHYGLVLALTCAQLLILYFLSDSANPPRGLGLFTVYFMAALMGWILFTLQPGRDALLDVPAIVALATGYLLYLACAQRAGIPRGRYLLGALCLAACLSAFYFPPSQMFAIQLGGTAGLWAAAGAVSGYRGWTQRNVGDAIIALAGLLVVAGHLEAWLGWQRESDLSRAQADAIGVHSAAYALVVVGFLASVLLEYQRHLTHLATEDPLTRLLNRRGLEDAIYVSLASASRHNLNTSAIKLDIDHFKQVNDSFGHDTGDQLIQQVAQVLQRLCRASDVVARVGGEEFLLVLPNTDRDGARVLAERIRGAIGGDALLVDGQRIAITASLGVTTAEGEVDLDSLAREADRALYQAKREGRNRVATVDNRPQHFRSTGPVTGDGN
ncbi:GGDEF domain-containing protein [Parahaliea mediterranea]|uniref:diguanylate cyclase n=1 Tax=Parahaliea mediterranea TaxID=651086 RepID=A0A939DDP2_9GAMM|nr:GGDEF domain-containing protein [Parahaliea mediterranea]MBN7796273.1 GGDEF domain-containing protein [Parahaliea mediterranea]